MPGLKGFYSAVKLYSWDKVPQLLPLHHEYMSFGADEDLDSSVFYSYAYSQERDLLVARTHHLHTTHSSTETPPKVFRGYEAIEAIPQTEEKGFKTYSSISEDLELLNIHYKRNMFATFTCHPSLKLDKHITEIYVEMVGKVKHAEEIVPAIVFQQMPKNTLRMMAKDGGNCLGLKEDDGPLINVEICFRWAHAGDDELCYKTVQEYLDRMEAVAKVLGAWHPYKYINYSEHWQDVFAGYGKENLAKLKRIQRKYDPDEVFTEGGLASGYFKVNKKGERVL